VIEKVATWAIGKAITEDIDPSLTTAVLVGVALDTATFTAIGAPATVAVAGGAALGAVGHAVRKAKRGEGE
jgi:hypothetical protein